MKIEGSIALVTGANRGLGAAFARGLLAGGAAKVYAAARDPTSVTLHGVGPVRLDVTEPEHIAPTRRGACFLRQGQLAPTTGDSTPPLETVR